MSDDEMAAFNSYMKKYPHACVEDVRGPFLDDGGREYYIISDAERDSDAVNWFCSVSSGISSEQAMKVVIAGTTRNVFIRLRPGHSAKDHYFGDVLTTIRHFLAERGVFKTKKQAEEAIWRAGSSAVRGGPAFSIEITGR